MGPFRIISRHYVKQTCVYFCWSPFEFSSSLQAGFVVLLVERSDAVSTKPVKTSYSSTAGTAFVTFDKARVPVANTLGQVGKGMSIVLSNFNHERWMVTATSLGAQRLVVEECLK
jgi:alkylation response protein AidB-like acyl-CoA dehydrogenase